MFVMVFALLSAPSWPEYDVSDRRNVEIGLTGAVSGVQGALRRTRCMR
jgi:hypothetical protein